MNESRLETELRRMRTNSLRMAPIAAVVFAALAILVVSERLDVSEHGFLAGLLLGVSLYWAVLEPMTAFRIGKLLRKTARRESAEDRQSSPFGNTAPTDG